MRRTNPSRRRVSRKRLWSNCGSVVPQLAPFHWERTDKLKIGQKLLQNYPYPSPCNIPLLMMRLVMMM
ncbi:hypothetical protein BHE74_00018479 [Ensete ventricosum]|nr:hypothetical protein BHE74_00018479 [Ensete ventricosum]RZR87138.1 hypothetical protein BHM03_00014479 [Ensete ventricosum]